MDSTQLGIFANTFSRPSLTGILDAVKGHGLNNVHFDMACAGLPSLPDRIEPALCQQIRSEMAARDLTMVSVSGTYNMAHPDPEERQHGLRCLGVLAGVCHSLGTSVITLCTGTRDRHNQWRYHPDNSTAEAWGDMLSSIAAAVAIAADYSVTLAFEPEVSNVVDSTAKARRLLDEIGSPQLKVIIDGANLFPAGTLPRQHDILNEAFAQLGDDIIMAHAKDLDRDGQAGHLAAGTGLLDYDHYLALLQEIGFEGSLVLHGLAESQVNQCVRFLHERISRQ